MKTRVNDFLNVTTHKPEYSFQVETSPQCTPRWIYVKRSDGEPMRWGNPKDRDRARACFSSRKTQDRALQDLQRLGLHVGQPGQATTSTDESNHE